MRGLPILPHVRDPTQPTSEMVRGQRRRLSTVPKLGVIILDEVRGMVVDVRQMTVDIRKSTKRLGTGRRKNGLTVVWFELANKDVMFYWGSLDPWVDYLGQGEIVKRIIVSGDIINL